VALSNQGGTLKGSIQPSSDPQLGFLGSGGSGPTATMPLSAGSPAIGSGDPATCSGAPVSGVDQRGLPRATCDIGAWQTQPATSTPGADAGTGQGTGGGFTCAASGAKNQGGLFSFTALALGIGALLRRRRTPGQKLAEQLPR
jgi:uncharacterized protein (TIGR03382 family)